ncbi:transporter [Streptomyces tardus]|uniref:transporter n=1 Tax=Streptomyces tardus TaxID=2780544 RepID=UPI00355797B7
MKPAADRESTDPTATGAAPADGTPAPSAPETPAGPQSPSVAAPAPAGARAVPSGPAVTGTMVRLKWSLLANGLQQSAGRTAAFVTAAVLAVVVGGLLLLGLLAMRGRVNADALAVFLTATTALGWAVLPLFAGGGDETLDPGRMAMLPLRPRPLLAALTASSLIGVGPLFTLLLALGCTLALAHGAAGALVGVLAVPLVLLTCVALARAVATANSRMLASRKGKDLALLSGLMIAFGMQAVNLGLQQIGDQGGLGALRPYSDVLRWLPPASAVEAVRAAGAGEYALAALGLATTALALLALLWWWLRSLTRLMVDPDSSTIQPAQDKTRKPSGDSAQRGLGRLLPEGRTAVVIERTLRYAWRDPKTKTAWATSIGLGLLMPFITSGSVYSACWVAGMMGLLMYNQFGQDTSAFWMVAATISDRRDAYVELRARSLAIALITVPFTVVVVVVSAARLDDWGRLAPALGIALAVAGVLVGLGAVSSAYHPYSIPQDSGYRNVAPGQGALAYLSFLLGAVVGALLCLPLIVLLAVLSDGGAAATWVLLPLGVVYGTAVAYGGLRVAAARTADRLPEILSAVSKG